MHPNRIRRLIVVAACTVVVVAAPSIWFARQRRQLKLNHDLIAAINSSDADIVDIALAAGADPNARDSPQQSKSLREMIISIMRRPSAGPYPSAILLALQNEPWIGRCSPQTVHIVKALLERGAEVNVRGDSGNTPLTLLFCISRGDVRLNYWENTQLLEMLLSAGADADSVCPNGEAALTIASFNNWPASVRMLLSHGANPEPKTVGMWGTPLLDRSSARQHQHRNPAQSPRRKAISNLACIIVVAIWEAIIEYRDEHGQPTGKVIVYAASNLGVLNTI